LELIPTSSHSSDDFPRVIFVGENFTVKPLALIIEDDSQLADIFTYALQTAGFETETIQDGQTARARLADTAPTVVVLDLHLPHVSGEELLRQIRADKRLAQTRVILATADALTASHLRQDADLVLLKPISVSQLSDLAARLRPRHDRVQADKG
jgi:DNA-binding response OmpR family regulator